MMTSQLLRMTQFKSSIPLSIKVFTVLFATLTIFHQDLIILANEVLQSKLMTHILTIPFLFIYLIYRKRKTLQAAIPFETNNPIKSKSYIPQLVGVVLCLTAFLLYWHGSYTFTPLEYHIISLPVFTTGLILIMFNTRVLRALVFPIIFLLFLTPPPLEAVSVLGTHLSTLSSAAAHALLKAIGLRVSLTEQYGTPVINLLRTNSPPLTFAIDIACAGIYSLIGFTIFAVFIAYIAKGKPAKKCATFLIGFPVIYALNILRITTIVLIGNHYGMQTAIQAFHLLGGWTLIFLGTLLLLTISEKLLKIQLFTRKPCSPSCPECSQSRNAQEDFCKACGRLLKSVPAKLTKADTLKIAALMIVVSLVASIQTPVFALTQGPAEILIQTPTGQHTTTEILPEIPRYTSKFIYRDRRFEETAGQDASLTYTYTPTNKTEEIIWITLEVAKSRSNLHEWEDCWITWPQMLGEEPEITQFDLRDIRLLENPPITARFFAFQRKQTDRIQVILYWYENARFQTNTTSQQEYVKISLISYAETPRDVLNVENMLLPFGEAVVNYWQPIKAWSQIVLTITQNGTTLIAFTTTLLIALLIYQAILNQQHKKANQKTYQKLASQDQQILKAIHQTEKYNPPATTQNIAATHRSLTGKPITPNTLYEKLEHAQNIGLVEKVIINQEDQPMLAWKNQILL